jgi:hypothetical protein
LQPVHERLRPRKDALKNRDYDSKENQRTPNRVQENAI